MAYDEKLADRTREIIASAHERVEEKKMFGGLCFMVDDKMCVGVESKRLMLRLDPSKFDEVMEKEGCSHELYPEDHERFCVCGSCSPEHKKEIGILGGSCTGLQ